MKVPGFALKLMPPPARGRPGAGPERPAVRAPDPAPLPRPGPAPRLRRQAPAAWPLPKRSTRAPWPRLTLPRPRLPGRSPAFWSRYTLALTAVLVLGVLVRLPGIWAAPLDTPSEPQAALAVFVRRLAQGADLTAALPWAGPLPTNPIAGLPLFAWLAALLTALGGGAWAGRVVALLGALLATGLLYIVVRRLAGGRAAVYAALFLTLTPPGLYYGHAYLPESLGWAAACGGLAAVLRWRDGILAGRADGPRWLIGAAAAAGFAILIDPANLALVAPLVYLVWPHRRALVLTQLATARSGLDGLPASLGIDLRQRQATARTLQWHAYGFAGLVVVPLLLWWGLLRLTGSSVELDPAYGGGGLGAVWSTLRDGHFYNLLAGRLVNETLTFAGLLLLLAGLGRPVRQPWPWAIHLWVAGGLVIALFNGPRLAADDSTLVPWVPALAALAGLGANWLATLPALIAAVLRGQEEDLGDLDADQADGVPADEPDPGAGADGGRPLRHAVRKPGLALDAAARRAAAWPGLRNGLLRLGNAITILLMLGVVGGGLTGLLARYAVAPVTLSYAAAGVGAAGTDPGKEGGRMVVAGPGAPAMFYASGLTGWAVPEAAFDRSRLDALKAQGAGLLLSADPDWLRRQPEYPTLLASFGVARLEAAPPYIVFDLRHPPANTDYRYFLQTQHTLRGAFRGYFETHGDVAQFGYPLTEELKEVSPEDGQERTVQYFQRAIFELHPDKGNTPYMVQLAPAGKWLLGLHEAAAEALGSRVVGIDPVPPAPDTPAYHYAKETGHAVKGEFLKFWQSHGGVGLLGYPVTEELNEILPADGKVHIVQYFERARLEWHQEAAGTPAQVQLGLVGKEWLERPAR